MKAFRPYIAFVLIVATLCLLWSFQARPKKNEKIDVETQIRLAVDEKLANRKIQKMEHCREVALKEAEEMVDSILMAQAKLTNADTMSKPPKPPKPELLDVKKAKDNTPIKPLFDEKAIEEKTIKIEQADKKTIQQ